jgi:hypothetical protein
MAAVNLGQLLARQGDVQGATAAYRQAVESGHPDAAPAAAFYLGVLLAGQGDVQGARAAYRQAIESGYPDAAPMAAVNLGQLLAEQGDVQGARAAYRQAIDSGHPDAAPAAAFYLRRLLTEQGDADGAATAYQPTTVSGYPTTAPAAAASRGLAEPEGVDGARKALHQPSDHQPAEGFPAEDSALRLVEGSTVRVTREGDRVECSVFAPPMVSPGSTFMLQAFAHISSQTREAIRRAKEFDADAVRRAIKTLEANVPRGTRLSFDLTMPGLRVDDPVQSMVWRGTTESVQFGVTVPGRCRPGNVVGTLTVSQDWIPIGHIKFTLTVTAALTRSPLSRSAVGEAARRYKMAFISYASEDRTTVLERVQVLPTVGIRTFQDVLNLEPGQRWERSLYRHIDESDIILLFWSSAAKRSKWVRKEVRYALDRKHGDEFAPPEIGPVILEGPPVPRPWKELAYLHFNDPRIYIMDR